MRRHPLALAALLLISGCKKPEGGLKLVYSGASGAKGRVERSIVRILLAAGGDGDALAIRQRALEHDSSKAMRDSLGNSIGEA
jgi:hypothetical protein